MIIPPFLHPGDCIGIVAPARRISASEVKPAIDFLEFQGFRVALGKHLFDKDHQFAGTDEQRAADFQAFLDDPDIKAVLCARGGYGSVRIIDRLDFSGFMKNPKWICGYSDVTVFHSHLHRLGFSTLHSTMPVNIQSDQFDHLNNRTLVQGLTGGILAYSVPAHGLNRQGTAVGEVVGGNLSILYSLLGSSSDLDTEGKILFIEDLDEYLYHIDRMMMALKRAGKLRGVAGLVVGGMSQMNDNAIPFGHTAEEIVAASCAEYGFPVCFQFPTGHTESNVALRLGARAMLTVAAGGGTLVFSE
ncbi:MAG: LD-carboxypeptidase [Bacteroidales bacterium]|nr:LD-carboxypeptidase [Bacteroidales bacterium]